MNTRKHKVIETLNGLGKIYKGEKCISDALYNLDIIQEYLVSRALSGNQELPGMIEISGYVSVIKGEKDLCNGEVMTLELKDKRKWKFFASSGDFLSGKYKTVSANSEGITE